MDPARSKSLDTKVDTPDTGVNQLHFDRAISAEFPNEIVACATSISMKVRSRSRVPGVEIPGDIYSRSRPIVENKTRTPAPILRYEASIRGRVHSLAAPRRSS